jgi:hypothetical protein
MRYAQVVILLSLRCLLWFSGVLYAQGVVVPITGHPNPLQL